MIFSAGLKVPQRGASRKQVPFGVRCLFGMQEGCNEYVMRTKDVVG